MVSVFAIAEVQDPTSANLLSQQADIKLADLRTKLTVHKAWTWTCIVDMFMQHGHGHAAWTWQCNTDMSMSMLHVHGKVDAACLSSSPC